MKPLRPSMIAGVILLASELFSGTALGVVKNDSDATIIQETHDALAKPLQYPWFDAERDALKPIRMPQPVKPWSWNWTGGSWGSSWSFGDLFEILIWLAFAALLGAIAYVLIREYLKREASRAATAQVQSIQPVTSPIDMEALPLNASEPVGDLLAAARRCHEQGRLREAMIYLFSYQLVELNKQQLIHLARGKTNRQYLREVRNRPTLVPLFEQSIMAFETAFFGNRPLLPEQFEGVWQQLGEFNTQLSLAGAS